jgi:hypothetical protein
MNRDVHIQMDDPRLDEIRNRMMSEAIQRKEPLVIHFYDYERGELRMTCEFVEARQ